MMLPNPELVQQLFQAYYATEPARQEAYVSSHWADYSGQFDVIMDSEGSIRKLVGRGFGGMTTRNPLEVLVQYAGHLSYLSWLPNRREILALMRVAQPVCLAMGFFLSFDAFRQLCALALIRGWMSPAVRAKRLTVLMIGDGYGFLSSMVKTLYPRATLVLVDIGRTLLFQSIYCQRAHPTARHYGMTGDRLNEAATLADHDFIYCPTEYLDAVRPLRYDLAVAIASLQEMNAATVERYFRFLRDRLHEDHLFYCCNRESKVLRGGEVSTFAGYPWDPRDRHLVDERCPWYQYACSWRTCGPGPRLFGLRVPFINAFDGPFRHRLSILARRS
ncbi:MAG: putative sugar O-methyltransferase [Candidatus Omnitrophica bacterium]|nr:putative sugar O-methyltransferase [Candidatus Omnitrophota bacterium]